MDSSTEDRQLVIVPKKTVAVVTDKPLALTRQIEQGQQSRFSEEEVMTFKDLPTESHGLDAILQHATTYELIDFLARLQVAIVARMAQEHAEQQMVERALANEMEFDDEPKLQKVGRKRATKKHRTRIELPDLNTTLVEAYRELARTTRVAKDMAVNIKEARKQAKTATKLWQALELHLTTLEA